jgi:hypothetical protein
VKEKRERMNVAGIVKIESHDITYSNISLQLKEIERNHRTGVLIMEWDNFQFLVFCENGIPTQGFRIIEERLYACSHLSKIFFTCPDTHMGFHPTSSAVLQALLDIKVGTEPYGVLYTNYTDMHRLFIVLKKNFFSGTVRIDLSTESWVIVLENGILYHIIGLKEKEKDIKRLLSTIFDRTEIEDGIIHIYERRDAPRLMVPDLDAVCCWSSSEHLTLEFAYGQLGKEFQFLLDKNLTLSAILDRLMVDFVEIADMYTYLSAKGYLSLKKAIH